MPFSIEKYLALHPVPDGADHLGIDKECFIDDKTLIEQVNAVGQINDITFHTSSGVVMSSDEK